MSIPVTRLNHAVLYVRNLDHAVAFYRQAFGFDEVARAGRMAFLRVAGSSNHHDLGLMEVGEHAPGPVHGATGLYHLAWEVPGIDDLGAARDILIALDAMVGQSDHGATKSLYGRDPDGNEFEVMWMLPREEWGEYEHRAVVQPLHLEQEMARRRG
jgi:catechol-2,3-dioxygenase